VRSRVCFRIFHGFFPFLQQAADFAGQEQKSFRVRLDRRLLAELHPFFVFVVVVHIYGLRVYGYVPTSKVSYLSHRHFPIAAKENQRGVLLKIAGPVGETLTKPGRVPR
jgi:hypothetical protein